MDIDKILIVTFTNAAASEMRERILDAIYDKLEKNPEEVRLQRQITLLNKASICTIHSFCLDVIRNNFYEADVSANFRIGDTAEVEMIKADVLEDLFEQKYMDNDPEFIKLLETYTDYRGDEKLQDLVLTIYRYIQSSPFPNKWLESKVAELNVNVDEDFANTVWGKIILDNVKSQIEMMIVKLENIKNETLRFTELEKFSRVLEANVNNLKSVKLDSWDIAYNSMNSMDWGKWPVDKKVTLDLKNEAKDIRDSIKKEFNSIVLKYTSKEANQDILDMYNILNALKNLILEFSEVFSKAKREKNIIDFNDIEHLALKILVNENEEPTEIAKKYQEKFEEIAIDEYQDSNLVQEKILTSISKGNNIFMVGDVKQSIYKFRQARPELFLEKYDRYAQKDEQINENMKENNASMADVNIKEESTNQNNGLKIKLFKNFRSRESVLDSTNLVFENIMSKALGDIDYNEEEYLNYGANYISPEEILQNKVSIEENSTEQISNSKEFNYAGKAELHIIDLKEKEEDIYTNSEEAEKNTVEKSNSILEKNIKRKDDIVVEKTIIANKPKEDEGSDDDEDDDNKERIEDSVLEARFVAKKVDEILKSGYHVYDRKQKKYRKVKPSDICILLRATSVLAPIYEKEISELNLPVFSDSSDTYLEAMEVETIMNLLKVIDNPMQDIPLVSVLRSSIFGFTDNDLIEIRLVDKKSTFYEAMQKARISVETDLRHKIDDTINKLNEWKSEEKYIPLNEFIWKLYIETGFYNYVGLLPNGSLRQANLKLLFEKAKQYETASFKGLFNFINFINKVKTSSKDMASAKIIGENDDVIRIMSIHKSKGLEFPIVFLASTGKKFNMQDLNNPILLHQDIGIGMEYMDSERKIEYSTLAKEAIKLKIKKETISEEMRVLYVALTRAKEKLIITGLSRDLTKSLEKKTKLLSNFSKSKNNKIPSSLVEKFTSYLDWLELVYEKNKEEKIENTIELHTYNKQELISKLKNEENEVIDVRKQIEEKVQKSKIDENTLAKLKWQYKYIESSKIPTNTSVTKLKELNENKDIEDLINEAKKKVNKQTELSITPKFMEEKHIFTPAEKGTLLHLCVQKLNESKDYTREELQEFVSNLKDKNIISEEEQKNINTDILYKYTKSELWQDLKQAKEIHKETPFYINIPATEIYDEAEESEKILVQGIIDLYYIDKNDNLILVDYKTDYVPNGDVKILEEKYKVQLDIYKKALEEATGKKVYKAMIWALNK